jgi:hypothetical protein
VDTAITGMDFSKCIQKNLAVSQQPGNLKKS